MSLSPLATPEVLKNANDMSFSKANQPKALKIFRDFFGFKMVIFWFLIMTMAEDMSLREFFLSFPHFLKVTMSNTIKTLITRE